MRLAYPDTEFYPGVYSELPPVTEGKDVYFLDFCYSSEVMAGIYSTCNSLVILDHHKTAVDACAWLLDEPNCRGVFDMDRSGAMIAWEYFHENKPAPQLIHHIQDRDLWRFKLDGTESIQAALFSYPYDFDVWGKLMGADLNGLRSDGDAISRKQHKDIAELRGVLERRMVIAGYDVPVMNVPYTLVSDAANLMAFDEPFAACYWDSEKHRAFGLRSLVSGIDVSEIAKQYGGGGHVRASGFSVDRDHVLAQS